MNKSILVVFSAVILIAGCQTAADRQSANDAYLDKLLNREPRAVREKFIADHPELDQPLAQAVKDGDISTSTAQRRLDAASHDKKAAEDRVRLAEESNERRKQEEQASQKARDDYLATPGLSNTIIHFIKARQICIGMNSTEVMLSWGEPRKRSEYVSAAGSFQTWYYSNRDTALEFSNHILTSWTATQSQ